MRKKSLFLLLGVLLSFGMLAQSYAAGVGLPTAGSRAVNLGGAYRALSGDWSAGFWNPAGMTRVDNWNVGANFSTIMPTASLTPASYEDHSFNGYADTEVDAVAHTFFIPTTGFVHSLDNGFSYGFGVFIPFGLGATWDLFNPVPGYNNEAGYPEEDYESDLKVIDFHFSGAYKVTDKFSVGLGFGVVYNDIIIRQPSLSKPFEDTALKPLVKAPHDYLVTELELVGTGISYSFNGGIIYDVNDKLSLGASFRYYTDADLDGEILATNYYTGDPVTLATLTALHDAGQIDDATYQAAAAAFSGQKMTYIDDSDAKATMPLPMNVGVGIAYRPTPKLLFSFDVDWTQWSSWDTIPLEDITAVDGSTQDSELIENWDDTWRYSFGAEYIAYEKPNMSVALRGGYYYETAAIPDETIGPSIPDSNDKQEIILGTGLTFGKIGVNLLYVHIFVNDRNVDTWNIGEDYGNENVAGLYKADVNEFHVGLEYNF